MTSTRPKQVRPLVPSETERRGGGPPVLCQQMRLELRPIGPRALEVYRSGAHALAEQAAPSRAPRLGRGLKTYSKFSPAQILRQQILSNRSQATKKPAAATSIPMKSNSAERRTSNRPPKPFTQSNIE
jgi:hypothetical protein